MGSANVNFPFQLKDRLWYVDANRDLFEVEVCSLEATLNVTGLHAYVGIKAVACPFSWSVPLSECGESLFTSKEKAEKTASQCCKYCSHQSPYYPPWGICKLQGRFVHPSDTCDQFNRRQPPKPEMPKLHIPEDMKERLGWLSPEAINVDLFTPSPEIEKLHQATQKRYERIKALLVSGVRCTTCRNLGSAIQDDPNDQIHVQITPVCLLTQPPLGIAAPQDNVCEFYFPMTTVR